MYYLKLFIICCTIMAAAALSGGCGVASYAPKGYLPDIDEIETYTYGGWMSLLAAENNDSSGNSAVMPAAGMSGLKFKKEDQTEFGGEFIGDDDGKVYLLFDTIYVVEKKNITKIALDLDDKSNELFAGITLLGPFSAVSNGFYSLITIPIWLTTGIWITSGETYRDTYRMDYPDAAYWENVRKFARFPQGMPKGIVIKDLKPKMDMEEFRIRQSLKGGGRKEF